MSEIGRNVPSLAHRRECGERTERRRHGEVQSDGDAVCSRLRMESCNATEGPKLGATTIALVALSRPRAIRSRIASLTPGEMP